MKILNSNIFGNVADSRILAAPGGGIYSSNSAEEPTLDIINSIVTNN